MQLSEIIECVKDNANEGTTYSKFKKNMKMEQLLNILFGPLPILIIYLNQENAFTRNEIKISNEN